MKLDFTIKTTAVSYETRQTEDPGWGTGTPYPTLEAAIRVWQATTDHDASYVRILFTDS